MNQELQLFQGRQLIPHGTGYIILHPDGDILVPKVPTVVYQICFDAAQRPFSEEWKQVEILKVLQDWAREKYPEYDIVNFLDMDRNEANFLTEKIGFPFTWGMYLVLQKGANTVRLGNNNTLTR